jgi:hypothetical protein
MHYTHCRSRWSQLRKCYNNVTALLMGIPDWNYCPQNECFTCANEKKNVSLPLSTLEMGGGQQHTHTQTHMWHADHHSTHVESISHRSSLWHTPAGKIPTFTEISIHEMLPVYLNTAHITLVAVAGAPQQETSDATPRPAVMAFTHHQTISYAWVWVPKPSFNRFNTHTTTRGTWTHPYSWDSFALSWSIPHHSVSTT